MIALPALLPLVIKYATKLGRIHLAEKLGELLPQFEEQEKEREKYDENEAANELLLSTPTLNGNLIHANLEKNSTPSIVPVSYIIIDDFQFLKKCRGFTFNPTGCFENSNRDHFRSANSSGIHLKRRPQVVARLLTVYSNI